MHAHSLKPSGQKSVSGSEDLSKKLASAMSSASTVLLGKEYEIKLCFSALLAGGHILIEDQPGVGKTTLVKLMGKLLRLDMRRIQFTNDMLPGDILGSSIFDMNDQNFTFHKGPIFAQLILADEINRATPKTQSALLQAMEENQITVDGVTFELPKPFFVIATQNPAQNIGTFPLPESQMDRFLIRIALGFPDRKAEKELLMGESRKDLIVKLPSELDPIDVLKLQGEVKNIKIADAVLEYVQDIVAMSRMRFGGLSPRAALGMLRMTKAWALIHHRDFVIPDDVQEIATAVMNHRMSANDDPFGLKGAQRVQEILSSIRVQR